MTTPAPDNEVAFNPHQHADLVNRSRDLYAFTKYDIIRGWIGAQQPLTILNAGCGSGELSFLLAEDGHSIEGIDPVREYVDLAVAALPTAPEPIRSRLTFGQASVESYQSDRKFDIVVATDVLEHIEDADAAFAKLVSLVKPGGRIIITVPAGQWLFGYHDVTLGHFRRYTKTTLRQLVQSHTRIEKMRYFGFALIPVCLVFSCWLQRPYPVAESGDKKKNPLTRWILKTVLGIDSALPMPLGTSLLFLGSVQ